MLMGITKEAHCAFAELRGYSLGRRRKLRSGNYLRPPGKTQFICQGFRLSMFFRIYKKNLSFAASSAHARTLTIESHNLCRFNAF